MIRDGVRILVGIRLNIRIPVRIRDRIRILVRVRTSVNLVRIRGGIRVPVKIRASTRILIEIRIIVMIVSRIRVSPGVRTPHGIDSSATPIPAACVPSRPGAPRGDCQEPRTGRDG